MRTTRVSSRRVFLRQSGAAIAAAGLGCAGISCGSSTAPTLDASAEGRVDGSVDSRPADLPRADQRASDGVASSEKRDGAVSAPRPVTTVRQRVQGVLPSEQRPASEKKLWGVTKTVAGDPHQLTDLLGASKVAGPPTGPAASLLYFAHLSDAHVVDEESPARAVSQAQLHSSLWRAPEAYSAQLLDGAVRKLRAFNAVRPLDLVLFTGDAADNNQKNELDWFLDVMQGRSVVPNSGNLEDPVPGPANDPHDGFAALGLGPIPWYVLPGNHDHLIQGYLPHTPLLSYSLVTGDPTRDSVGLLDLGRVNPPACNAVPAEESAAPVRCIPTAPEQLKTGKLTPDTSRVHLTRPEWVQAVLGAGGQPQGHGFTAANGSSGIGDYVVDPVPGLPLRLIALDTIGSYSDAGEYSRWDSFLGPALQKAVADAVLVVVASHHPASGVSPSDKLVQMLAACPNVILHLCGHGHANQVIAHPGTSPLLGYWEVETAGLIDWPQQGRLIELVDKRDGTAELWLTLFDLDTTLPGGALVEGARFLALQEIHSGALTGGTAREGTPTDRNVILPVALPPEVREKLAALPGTALESALFY